MGKSFWLRKVNCKNLVEVERGQINLNCQESKVVLERDEMEFFFYFKVVGEASCSSLRWTLCLITAKEKYGRLFSS